ncbi:MAG: hypothetical protein JXJ04_13840, partial [Spirochaetales bacterium]|nr:hypothetical protein [Spirochaetales bacterium]
AVLVRGRGLLGRIDKRLNVSKDLMDEFIQAIYLWHLKERRTTDIEYSLKIFGKSLCRLAYDGKGQYQKQYCTECLDPIPWRFFLSDLLDSSYDLYSTIFAGDTLQLKNCTRPIKNFLEVFWEKIPTPEKTFEEISRKIRAPDKRGDEFVASCFTGSDDCLRMTTIHDVKGETLDAVLLISAPDRRGSKGGYYKDWLEPPEGKEEYQRLAYVAFSRPKHLLVVATPILNDEYLEKFQRFGFVPKNIPNNNDNI